MNSEKLARLAKLATTIKQIEVQHAGYMIELLSIQADCDHHLPDGKSAILKSDKLCSCGIYHTACRLCGYEPEEMQPEKLVGYSLEQFIGKLIGENQPDVKHKKVVLHVSGNPMLN